MKRGRIPHWTLWLPIVVFAGAVVAVAARAQNAHDNRTIPARVQERLLARHPELDANGDGVITREEIAAFRASRPEWRPLAGRWAARWDRLRQRVQQRSEKILKEHPEADLNADGRLDFQEAREFFKTHPGAFGQRLLARHPELDTDGDGQLSFAEFRAALLKRFPALDTNEDGVLRDDEVDAVRATMKERRRARLLERFGQLDTNGDGVLSDEEVKAGVDAWLGRSGANSSQAR
ncbi:MAG TPA: EF-hand domain-containing protein [Phycisphaerae bacterium]|jgi:Ca2+-binding EF-hand superfamily protein